MKLINEKVNQRKFYSVGYCPQLEKYVLSLVIAWVCYYNQYYEISKEEYELFDTGSLDELAKQLNTNGTRSERFLFSDLNEENTPEQMELRNKIIQYEKCYNGGRQQV